MRSALDVSCWLFRRKRPADFRDGVSEAAYCLSLLITSCRLSGSKDFANRSAITAVTMATAPPHLAFRQIDNVHQDRPRCRL
jgi:hypothetical protein